MIIAPCEIECDAPLSLFEKVCGVLALVSPFLGIALVAVLCHGCTTAKQTQDSGDSGKYDTPSVKEQSNPSFPVTDKWWKN